ncbi:unnamed protein product [Musa textilis]
MMGVSAASPSSCCLPHARSHLGPSRLTSLPVLIPATKKRPGFCRATKQQQQTGAAKKKAGRRKAPERPPVDDGGRLVDVVPGPQNRRSHSSPLPKPPAGFVLDDHGRVLLASSKRIVTIMDATNNLPLECVIRRVFQSSEGDECMLLCPVDPPVQILKSTNFDGWSACSELVKFIVLSVCVDDEEIEAIIPAAAYALAKIHMHLVAKHCCAKLLCNYFYCVYKLMVRQITFMSLADDAEAMEGLPTEGVKITCFNLDGTHYMIYTPSDPLLFVAVRVCNLVFLYNQGDS